MRRTLVQYNSIELRLIFYLPNRLVTHRCYPVVKLSVHLLLYEVFLPGRRFVFSFLGINGIFQTKKYAAAKENGQYAAVIVKKKNIKRYGGKELRVSYHQKDYWVGVAKSTFDSARFNKSIILKYDTENDTMIDEKVNKNEIVASILLIIGSVFFCWLYLKKD